MDKWLIIATHTLARIELELVPTKTQERATELVKEFSSEFGPHWTIEAIRINTAFDDETVTAEQP